MARSRSGLNWDPTDLFWLTARSTLFVRMKRLLLRMNMKNSPWRSLSRLLGPTKCFLLSSLSSASSQSMLFLSTLQRLTLEVSSTRMLLAALLSWRTTRSSLSVSLSPDCPRKYRSLQITARALFWLVRSSTFSWSTGQLKTKSLKTEIYSLDS